MMTTQQTVPNRLKALGGLMALALLLAGCGEGGESQTADAAPPTAETSVGVPTNLAPLIEGTPPGRVEVASAYSFEPKASDPEGDALTFTAEGLPAWATLDATSGRITGTPSDEDAGATADIELTVSDGTNQVALPAFSIEIAPREAAAPSAPGNSAPSISGTPAIAVTEGKAYSFKPSATDPDTLTLKFSIANKPAWASFSTTTGALAGTPGNKHVATYANIVITVTDGAASASLPAFTITVKAAPNAAPTISGTPATSITAGSAYAFAPVAKDPEGKALGFSIANKPAWASFNTATGALSGTPAQGHVGSYANIQISVSDGVAKATLPAFTITVKATTSGAPTISGQPVTSVQAAGSYSFQPTASDPNGDALTFSVSNKPSWASFNASTGRLSGTPGSANIGSFNNVVISVSDGTSSASLAPFNILVNGSTVGSAALSWTPPTQNTDGSSLTNLAGYRIYYGSSASSLTSTILVSNPGLTSYTVGNLTPGTYYFAVAAFTTDGVEGAQSGVGSKSIL
jgi:hypothetical protein